MHKLFFLLWITQLAFAQVKTNTLEEKIYIATENFSGNPSLESLKILENQEKLFNPKSKAEFLAMVYLYCNKAFGLNNFNQTEKAIVTYEKAWKAYQKHAKNEPLETYDIVEYCLKPLGNLYTKIGDYDNAENSIKQYFYIANLENNQAHKYAAILNLTNVFYYSGKNQEAINLLEKTINLEQLTESQKGVLYNSLGNNYLQIKNKIKAINSYNLSVKFLKNSNDNTSLSNAYRNIALLNNDLKLFEKAKGLMLENKNNSARELAKIYLNEAVLLFQNNKINQSQQAITKVFKTLLPSYSYVKNSLPSKNSLYAENTFIEALSLQATIFKVQDLPKKALESYALSFYVDELLQALLVYENSKIVGQINARNRTEKCIEIYYELYQNEKKINYLEEAFLLQEKTKSAVLKSAILEKKQLSKEEKILHAQLQECSNSILKEQQKLEYANISKINEWIKKQNELMLLLKSKSKSNKTNSIELDVLELYSKLEQDKAVLIEYFEGEKTLYCFTFQNKKITLQKINDFKETNLIYSFINFFKTSDAISNNPKQYNSVANSCYQFLRIPKKSNYKNLIIIPDGILCFLPFEALITKKSSTTNFAKMNYLLNDFTVSYNNSARFYYDVVPLQFKTESVLGIFPVFKNTSQELTYSVNEQKAIEKQFSGNYFSTNNATFSNFKQNCLSNSILHLSTHASSGDIFEPASIKFIEQDVLYSEFYNLDLQPNLVVLSACETGLGKLYKSEGAMSVARGFQFAGAQNLLFSLWKVNDFTTSVIMENFYKNINQKKTYAKANHQSKLNFLKNSSIPNAKKSPYYWSAFVYYGTLENKSSSKNYFLWISISVAVIILLIVILSFRRMKNRTAKKPNVISPSSKQQIN